MKISIKIILIGLGLLIIAPFITLIILSKIHHQTAHRELVEILNQEFEEEITFQDFNYSYLKKFPHVHLELTDITIKDSNSGISTIGKIDILLDLESLWNNKLNIEKLVIRDAFLHSEVDSLGNKPKFLSGKKKSTNSTTGSKKKNLEVES